MSRYFRQVTLTRRRWLLIGATALASAPLAVAAPAQAVGLLNPLVENWQPLSIVIPEFIAASPTIDAVAAEMTGAIRSILRNSDGISVRDDLDGVTTGFDAVPHFPFWRSHGVDVLVVGRLSVLPDRRLQAEFRLWGVRAGGQLLGQAYVAEIELWAQVAHMIAGKIYERVFLTR